MVQENKRKANIVIVCGARCIFQKEGKCNRYMKLVAAYISIDGKCIKFEPKDGNHE